MESATKEVATAQPDPMDRYKPKLRPMRDLRFLNVLAMSSGFIVFLAFHEQGMDVWAMYMFCAPIWIAVALGNIELKELPFLWSAVFVAIYVAVASLCLIVLNWDSGMLYPGLGIFAFALAVISFVTHARRLFYFDWVREEGGETE